VTSYWLDGQIRFSAGARVVSFLHSLQTDSEDHLASYKIGTCGFFLEVKRPEREANQSPPSSAEIKNVGVMPPLLHSLPLLHSIY
jgi:hypothetical protein